MSPRSLIDRSRSSAVAAMALLRLLLLLCCKIALADKDPSAGRAQLNAFWVAALQWWCEDDGQRVRPALQLSLFTHRHISATSDGTQIRGLSRQLNDNLPRTAAQQQKMFETMVTQFCEKAAAPPLCECGRSPRGCSRIVRGSGAARRQPRTPGVGAVAAARPREDAAGRPMRRAPRRRPRAHDRVAAMAAAKQRQRPPPGSLAAAAEHPHPLLRAAGAMAHAAPWASTTLLRPRDASVAAADAAAHLRASGVVSGGGGGGGDAEHDDLARALSSECHPARRSSAACESHARPRRSRSSFPADFILAPTPAFSTVEERPCARRIACAPSLPSSTNCSTERRRKIAVAGAAAGASGGGSSDLALLALVVRSPPPRSGCGGARRRAARLLGAPADAAALLAQARRAARADRVARTFGFGTADAEESARREGRRGKSG